LRKKGYEGTYLSDIAKGVGIKKPSIYNHFQSKEDIFLSIFQDLEMEHIDLIEQLVSSLEDEPAQEKLFRILDLTFEYYLKSESHVLFLKRALLFPPEQLEEQLKEKFQMSEHMMTAILNCIFQEGIDNGEIAEEKVENLIISYYCLIDGLFVQLNYYGKEEIEWRIHHVWNSFWHGIKR
jgi:TetR/AcrR family transcriptional repressor of cmeABC operon